MTYQLKVIKDYPVGFWFLDETSGTTASDNSGCGNDGTYSGGITTGLLPLIPGGTHGTLITTTKSVSFPITKDYSGSVSGGSVGDKYSLDNDFSVEVWFYPKIATTNRNTIFGDGTNQVGIFYEKGDAIFRFGNKEARYTLPYVSKSHHIVGTYNGSTLSLYHDGYLKDSIAIVPEDLGITHSGMTLSAGPAAHASDSFIVDAPAVYRYSLSSKQILDHFINAGQIAGIQVSVPDAGIFYNLSDENLKSQFSYSYPFNKSWTNFVTDDIFYDRSDESISLKENSAGGSVTVEFTDYITIPTNIGLAYSKVEWSGTTGITVETSTDGSSYAICTNGQAIPQYTLDSFSSTGKLYIKFTIASTDISKHITKLKYIAFNFYKTKDLFAENFGDKLTYEAEEYHLGSKKYPILSRDYRNGLRCSVDGGFNITSSNAVSTIEFFYTPTAFTDSGLVSSLATNGYAASNYSWRNSGTVSKTNVSAIYVNGVNKTSETDINNVFTAGELYHVVIVYAAAISNVIKFNSSLYGSTPSLYQNISLYPTAFNSAKAIEHYELYIDKASITSTDSSFTVTENTPEAYNNDWVVIQSI
jgi:hypothetical protein